MFRNMFRPDSPLMITLSQITDCIFLSLFWLLGCFPVVTIGASTAALYDAVYGGYRKGDKHPWARFLKSFRRNLRASLVPNLVFLVLFGLLGWGMIQLWNRAVYGAISWTLFSGLGFVGVCLAGILCLLMPMLSRFENTTAELLKNTFLLALANMPRTLALGLLNVAAILLCIRFVFPLFFLPALTALIGTLFIEPIFKPFLPEPAAEEE